MDEIGKMNDDIKEIISITTEKLNVLINQEILNDFNDLFAFVIKPTGSPNIPDNSTNATNLPIPSNLGNITESFYSKMSYNCLEFEYKFEKTQYPIETDPINILPKFINKIKNVIEDCAIRLNSLIFIKYNEIIKRLSHDKNEKTSSESSVLSNSPALGSTIDSGSLKKQDLDKTDKDKNADEISKFKSNFLSASVKELLDALFRKESKLCLGFMFISLISCLNGDTSAKNIINNNNNINIINIQELKIDSHFIPSILKGIIYPLLDLNLEVVNKLLSEEAILKYIATMASRFNSYDIFFKNTEKLIYLNVIEVFLKLYKKEKDDGIKLFHVNVLSFYSLNKSPSLLIETLQSKYSNIRAACKLAEKILLNFKFSEKTSNEENAKFLIDNLSKLLEEAKIDSNIEKIVLYIYNALLESFPEYTVGELSKKFLSKFYNLGLISMVSKKDESVIFSNNSPLKEINKKYFTYIQLNKDLSYIVRLSKVKSYPNPNLVRMVEDIAQILIKFYDLIYEYHKLELKITIEELLLFVLSKSPNVFNILQVGFLRYVDIYKKDLKVLCKLLYSCYDKIENKKMKCQENMTIETLKPLFITLSRIGKPGSKEIKQEKVLQEENYETNPQKILIEMEVTNNSMIFKFKKVPFLPYMVDYFVQSILDVEYDKMNFIIAALLKKLPPIIQPKMAAQLFAYNLDKIFKYDVIFSKKKMGKRYRNTTMILHSKRNIEGSANLSGLKNNMDTYRKVKDRICRNVLDALAGNYLDEVFDRFHELAPVCYHYFSSETEFVIKFTLKICEHNAEIRQI